MKMNKEKTQQLKNIVLAIFSSWRISTFILRKNLFLYPIELEKARIHRTDLSEPEVKKRYDREKSEWLENQYS